MARNFPDWLTAYLEYTSRQESPEHFHFWSGMSALASALGRRCWMDRGVYTLFPNQYIVLVAESALCRKSTSTRLSSEMLEWTGVDTVKEKLTVGYLYRHLADASKKGSASLVVFAPELGTLIGKDAHTTGFVACITSLYDCPKAVEYRTKTAGVDLIREPCLNLLGATTLDWMSTSMPGETIEGGFASRVLFIVGDQPRERIAWPVMTAKDAEMKEKLMHDMVQVSQLQGQFEVTQQAKDAFEHWYKHMKEPDDLRMRGFFGRKPDHVLKVSMGLSVSQDNTLLVDAHHIEQAIKRVEHIEGIMPMAFRGVAFGKSAKDIDRVLAQIEKVDKVGHSDLLRKNSCYMNGKEFNEIIKTLEESEAIERMYIGAKPYYKVKIRRQV